MGAFSCCAMQLKHVCVTKRSESRSCFGIDPSCYREPSCGFVIAKLARLIVLNAKLSRDIDWEIGNTAQGEKDDSAPLPWHGSAFGL